jgi:hypothetical protein
MASGFNFADKLLVVAAATQAMTASRNHDIDVSTYEYVALQVVWASLNTFDNVFSIQGSVDGTNFEAYTGSGFTCPGAAGNHIWQIDCQAINVIRIAYTVGTAGAGTYGITARLEVPA